MYLLKRGTVFVGIMALKYAQKFTRKYFSMTGPKLRKGNVKEPYQIGTFPDDFVHILAGELTAALAVGRMDIEGKDWEQIFAKAIKAEWKPSVVGLDDILVPALSAAWGAKTVKNNKPFKATKIRLISGRNSPVYSYEVSDIRAINPEELGAMVLGIWNERVAALYQKYKTLRTVVLLKGNQLNQVSVFEFPTIRYNPEEYKWTWNKRNNLVGYLATGGPKFTWQPHGSQFTIHEGVPDYALNLEISTPPLISTGEILNTVNFSEASYRVVPRVPSIEQPSEEEDSEEA